MNTRISPALCLLYMAGCAHAPFPPGPLAPGDFQLTSGELVETEAGAASSSSVFRLTTRRTDFGDVAVTFSVRNKGLAGSRSTPPVDWDGLHVFLRHRSQYHLYYASLNRRDNTVAIKKKTPGGPSNGGTYHWLTRPVPYRVPYGEWQKVEATVKNLPDGSVAITLSIDGRLLVETVDKGSGGPPIRKPGRVGIRGDNADFEFTDFRVQQILKT